MQAIAAGASMCAAGVGWWNSRDAEDYELFSGGRSTGIAYERGEADKRMAAAVMCRLMDSLRKPIKAFLTIPTQ